jgi:hypothetical protein
VAAVCFVVWRRRKRSSVAPPPPPPPQPAPGPYASSSFLFGGASPEYSSARAFDGDGTYDVVPGAQYSSARAFDEN